MNWVVGGLIWLGISVVGVAGYHFWRRRSSVEEMIDRDAEAIHWKRKRENDQKTEDWLNAQW